MIPLMGVNYFLNLSRLGKGLLRNKIVDSVSKIIDTNIFRKCGLKIRTVLHLIQICCFIYPCT